MLKGTKKRILVFPCGSEAGLEIHAALRVEKSVELIGASSVDSHGKVVFSEYDQSLPFIDNPDFIAALNRLIEKYRIDYIFPAYDDVILHLSDNRDEINAEVLVPGSEVCHLTRFKSKTYAALAGEAFCPLTFAEAEQVTSWPVFTKPDQGQGSQGVRVVSDSAEFRNFQTANPGHIFCEMLPGAEFTVDCFTDRHGVTLFVGPRRRIRVKSGIAVKTEPTEPVERFRLIAEKIVTRIPMQGAWFFQVKETAQGELKLLEIGPRIAGSMGLSRVMGANLALMTIMDRSGLDLGVVLQPGPIFMDRHFGSRYFFGHDYSHVYLDFDDTLTTGDRVNIEVMAFVHHARNQGRSVILLTRHAGDIHRTLANLGISETLFENVVHIKDKTPKSDFIEHRTSIFIDDSFAERRDVFTATGVPCFSPDAIEALIDWRTP